MHKKASLSLSINAIVILVLAITMLGLGLAFTKGMFGKLSSKLSVPEPDIPATADDRIVLPSEELSITKNKEFIFSVNVYNDNFVGDVSGKLECPPQGAAGAIMVESAKQNIPAGEDKGFKFIVTKDQVTQSSTRICTLSFLGDGEGSGTESKQIVIAIK
jgi:hypothetical protein